APELGHDRAQQVHLADADAVEPDGPLGQRAGQAQELVAQPGAVAARAQRAPGEPGGEDQEGGGGKGVEGQGHRGFLPQKRAHHKDTKSTKKAGRRGGPHRIFSLFLVFLVSFVVSRLHAVWRMWQFLYFLPLPHGQGSLRPTLAPRLRIGSVTFSPWPLFVVCCAAAACADSVGAAACVAGPVTHSVSAKAPVSPIRNSISVTLSSTPSHMVRNSFMPSRL